MDLLLNRVDWHIDFSAYLVVSTNLAPALFGVLHRIDWNVRAVAAVTWPGGSWTMGPDGTLTFPGAPQVTIQPGADVAITPQPLNALSPAESAPVEIGRPTLQDCQCDDATG